LPDGTPADVFQLDRVLRREAVLQDLDRVGIAEMNGPYASSIASSTMYAWRSPPVARTRPVDADHHAVRGDLERHLGDVPTMFAMCVTVEESRPAIRRIWMRPRQPGCRALDELAAASGPST
jgi:hypothetical protein